MLGLLVVLAVNGSAWGQCEVKLFADDGDPFDAFGASVSLSGNKIAIGAPEDDIVGIDSGAVYVYAYDGFDWVMEQKIIPGDGSERDQFGCMVSLDGDRLAVGVPLHDADDVANDNSGIVYLFVWDGTSWIEETKLVPSAAGPDRRFGQTVSLDGDTLVAGSHNIGAGRAFVFRLNGGSWAEEQMLTSSDGAGGDQFGLSLSLDGDTVVIGAHGDDVLGDNSGSAYVFTRVGSTWSETAKLWPSDGAAGDQFSHSGIGAGISLDGDTVVIGSFADDDRGDHSGSAYVFRLGAGSWTQEAKLVPKDGAAGDQFGLVLSLDGDSVLIGARHDDDQGTDSGSAYLFEREDGGWTERRKLLASDGDGFDRFGDAVSLEGSTAVVGASRDEHTGNTGGSAYVFDLSMMASWENYGDGWPGTEGVPSFVASADPVIGTTIDLDIGNSLGATTGGVLVVGTAEACMATRWDGKLLVGPAMLVMPRWYLRLQPGITSHSFSIPSDMNLCGSSLFLQVLEFDPGASKGVSFTRGLKLSLGI